jgi:hypothetical protein
MFLSFHAVPTKARDVVVRQNRHDRDDSPAQYYFARKVTDPCGAPREVLESVTRKEVINMVTIVKEQVDEAIILNVSIDFKMFRAS